MRNLNLLNNLQFEALPRLVYPSPVSLTSFKTGTQVARLRRPCEAISKATVASKETQDQAACSRRKLLATATALSLWQWPTVTPAAQQVEGRQVATDNTGSSAFPAAVPDPTLTAEVATHAGSPDYTQPGPFQPVKLPRLEHTCSKCFPGCVGMQCLLRIDVVYPRGGSSLGLKPPYPLAIFTGGFLVSSTAYFSYAQRLASWGYCVVLWDKLESALDNIDDDTCAKFITEIMDWVEKDPILSQLADTQDVYLCGHSRGGKLSVLAAAADPRVAAVCLVDPVDNTQWAPLGLGYPSAVAALQALGSSKGKRQVPVAVIGSGLGGDCVPKASNYRLFYEACTAPTWELVVQNAGHFQFLDQQSAMQRAICAQGAVDEKAVREAAQAVMVAWAEVMLRPAALRLAHSNAFARFDSTMVASTDVPGSQTDPLLATQHAVTRMLERRQPAVRGKAKGSGGQQPVNVLEAQMKNFEGL